VSSRALVLALFAVPAAILAQQQPKAADAAPETPRIAELNRKLQAEPNDIWTLEDRAHAYALLGQRNRALADIKRVADLAHDDVALLSRIGWSLFNLRDFKPALDFWLRSGEVCNYDTYYADYTVALGYWGVQDLTTAAYYYDRAVAKDAEFATWTSLQKRVETWTSLEKQGIYEVFDAWRRGYKARQKK
jgi:tetratricopeptide (TPR) repeat protein